MELWDKVPWDTIWSLLTTPAALVVFAALGKWYLDKRLERFKVLQNGEVNKEVNKELELFKAALGSEINRDLERHKGDIRVYNEKVLHTYKIQLDNERVIYTELWQKLLAVREALQSIMLYKIPSEPTAEEERERHNRFNEAVKKLGEVANAQQPFYAERIARDLLELLELTRQEAQRAEEERAREIESSGPRRKTVSHDVLRRLEAIDKASNRVCESIRERLTGTEIS